MPLSVISFLLLFFQIFHSGGDWNHVRKTDSLVAAHHGFTFRKSCVIRNFVYAIGADELEDAEHGGTEIAGVVSAGQPIADRRIISSNIVLVDHRNESVSNFTGPRLFLVHCNFRV